jgi:hypothetical protein
MRAAPVPRLSTSGRAHPQVEQEAPAGRGARHAEPVLDDISDLVFRPALRAAGITTTSCGGCARSAG